MDNRLIKEPSSLVQQQSCDVSKNGEVVEIILENEEKPLHVEDFDYEKKKPPVFEISIKEESEFDEMNNRLVEYEAHTTIEQKSCNVSFEIKLEDEDKPPLLEKFELSENKASISENAEQLSIQLAEVYPHTCCYCGEKRALEHLIKPPRDRNQFSKWFKILGKKFCKDVRNLASPMVCRSHFDNEFAHSILVSWLDINTERMRKLKCCYCGKSQIYKSLTHVPKDQRIFAQWAAILGERFVASSSKTLESFICRSHFDFEWQGNRPKHLLPIPDLDDRSFEKASNTIMKYTSRIGCQNTYCCVYCGEAKLFKLMTAVPRSMYYLKKWTEILGEEFYERALSKKAPFICRSHFNVKWTTRRPISLLPCVYRLSKQVKQEECELPLVTLSTPLMETTNQYLQIKLEELVSDEKSVQLLDHDIKSEYENPDDKTEIEFEDKSSQHLSKVPKKAEIINEHGPSESKRIDIEAKEEPIQ